MGKEDSLPTSAKGAAAMPRRRRRAWVAVCLGAIVLAWAALMMLARHRTGWAIDLTHWLFGWTILATYLALWAAWILGSRAPKPAVFNGIMVSLMLLAVIGVMELTAAT